MKHASIIVGSIALILLIGYVVTQPSTTNSPATDITTTSEEVDEMTNAENESVREVETTSNGTTPEESTAGSASTPGQYLTYDEAVVLESDAERKFLFFHASWCPSCRALEQDITTNEDRIPEGVAIFKVDYDTATDLKRELGIVRQHSVVEIDANGNAVGSITHPPTLDALAASL